MRIRLPKPGRTTSVILGVLAAVAIVVMLFDWNWIRHPVERYLIDRSHREVRIGDLHVDLGFSLEPTVRIRDVYIENAPWADKRPFIVAKEVSFTFSLKSVWEKRPVISRLVLIDAELDMERQADGLRNWRLRNPEDLGPGKVKVMRLEPHRTKIRFVRRDVDLDITVSASSSQSGAQDLKADASHPTRIDFTGEFGGSAFSGAVLTGGELTILETGESFPMRGYASSGKSRLDVDGTIADMLKPSAINAKMHLAGPSLSNLHAFFRRSLPPSRPYNFEAHIRQSKEETTIADLRGKIGDSDLSGEVSVDRGKQPTTVRAVLHSQSADLADLRSLVDSHSTTDTARKESRATEETEVDAKASDPDAVKAAPNRLFSDHEFDATSLKKLDARVTMDFKKLRVAQSPALESLRATVDLKHGVLALNPVDVGLAGGHVAGEAIFDGKQKALLSHAKMEWKDVRLEKLLAGLSKNAKGAGALQGRLDLKGQGDSIAKLAASVSGPVEIAMAGGSISNLLDAEIGLNGGKVVRALIKGERAIGVNSAAIAFEFDNGLGKSRSIALDTDQTRTQGTGTIDLREETVDVVLTPHPKKTALLALHSSIRVHGPIRKPKFSLARNAEAKEAREMPVIDQKAGRGNQRSSR